MPAGTVLDGSGMTVYTGGTPVENFHVGKWSITKTRVTGRFASNSTSGWRTSTAGVKEWTGSMTVFLHDGAALEWSVEGAEYTCQFHIDGGGSDYYSGNIRITEVTEELDADSGDPISVEISFEGSGALTANGTVLDV